MAAPTAWLRAAARRVAHHPRENAAQIRALGALLLEVKARLDHGRFRLWLARHFAGAYSMAAEAMALAKRQEQSSALRNFGPSAVRELAKRSVSKAKRDHILRTVKGSTGIGQSAVQLLILAQSDDDPADCLDIAATVAPAGSPERLNWRRLAALAATASMIHVSIDRDPEEPEAATVTVVAHLDDGGQRRAVRRSLAQALSAVAGEEALRRCPKCTLLKPPEAFAKSTACCRFCERARVKASEQRRRQAKADREMAERQSAS